ncbi:transmembrane protein 163a isoform X2 [Gymnodraco acuticeps]|uniref:Transmembrane protein 163a isoform X2 n=1 Tax=Gymnodraco acuticeps TaxID=8218 RepID=A0A6P8TKR9_GYMAC|nr:transmembrane protein 163a isoform X2 [Gymnodraco acuticeps]
MTDPASQDTYPVPDPTIVDPFTAAMRNGQCAQDGFTNNHHQPTKSPGQPDTLPTGQEMNITDSVEGEAVSFMRHSASAFGFAFNATLDILSSFIVLWRYSNAAAVHSAHREYIACVVLGVVFVLSSLCILGKAIHNLATREPPEVDDFLYSVSIVSGITCAVLAVAKFMLGRVLTSRALITDGFNSIVGSIMGFSILISAEIYKDHVDVWFLDGTLGVLIGLIIMAYGVKLLVDMVPRVRQTRNYERFE